MAASDRGGAFLRELVRVIGHRNRGRELLAVLNFLERVTERGDAFAYLAAFAEGLQRADVPVALFQQQLQPLIDQALSAMRDTRTAEATRVQAVELLGLTAAIPDTIKALLALLDSEQPRRVQSAALGAIARLDDGAIGNLLLDRWPRLTPLQRREVLPALLSRPERALALVKAIGAGTVLQSELTPTQRAFLMAHRSLQVREAAAALFTRAPAGDRRAVVQRYLAALDLRGAALRGKTTYQARCASCHEAGPHGAAVGPDLATVRSATKEEILTHVLDPNRTVDARFRLYLVETKDGKSATGIIQHETPTSLTLRPPFGQATTLPRTNIARIEGLEQSMMPDGLEEGLSLQDMADLLQFVLTPGS